MPFIAPELIIQAKQMDLLTYLKNYEPETVAQFYRSLAQVTPFWDFSSSSVSCEMRYFYDGTHFRNNVGEMICARMTGRTDLWIPDDFGTYVTADTPEDYFLNDLSPAALSADEISTCLLYTSPSPRD
mgnify:CR=1 FL=1